MKLRGGNIIRFILLLSIISLFFLPKNTFGQATKKEVYGIVVDTAGNPLKGVSVHLTSSRDTLFSSTSATGYFHFVRVLGNDIRISCSQLGLSILERSYPLYNSSTAKLDVGKLTMFPHVSLLKEIVIQKYKPIVYKQDTVQFNLDAFQFDRRALLEEALKALPNVQVSRDGSVYAFGKAISSVKVDGKKFFGGDVLTATRNLPADFVKSVQVIDFYGDEATAKGIKSTESEKVLNIVLKEDKKKITFGQATLGGGSAERYLGSVGVNRFDNGKEYSIVSSMNNTNTNLFSFGSPNGGEREREMGELADFADPTDGVNKISSIGASFSSPLSKTVNASGKYSFTQRNNYTKGNSFLQSIYGSGKGINNSISNYEDYKIKSVDRTHKMDWDFDMKLSKRDQLKISPKFSWSNSSSQTLKDRQIRNNKLSSTGNYGAVNNSESPSAALDLFYVRSFEKPGRKILYTFHADFNALDKDDEVRDANIAVDSSVTPPATTKTSLHQKIQSDNENKNIQSRLSLVEPVDLGGVLEINYDFDYTKIAASRTTFDNSNLDKGPILVDSLSLKYDYSFASNKIGMIYRQDISKDVKVNFGFAVQPSELAGSSTDKAIRTSYSNVNFVPSAGLKWKFTKEEDLSIDYYGRNNQPSFYQIQPIVDNTNTQNIIIGNKDLKSEFAHSIVSKYRKSMTRNGQYLEASLAYNLVNDKIVANRTIAPNSTVQKTSYVNTEGYYDIKSYYLFTASLFSDNLQMSLNGNADYYNNISYVNDKKSFGGHFLFTQAIQFRYAWNDIFEAELNGNYSLNRATFDWPVQDNITAHSGIVGLGSKAYMGKHFTIGLELSQKFNSGYSSSWSNINPTIINAYLEYTFGRNNLGMLRFQGFDLMNQNTGISRAVVGNDILDVQNNRLARYFMLSLNIRLQKYPKKS
ncbi:MULTISPECIES: TonB-dependent receptor [unclassified Sphingobacterium]|uniref:TonB-dependent receptor n=1 Tax=unclassified Sphingobacterium TaxID=2609468 RepID=UPI0025D3D9E6|nr:MULTISPECIES: TonB-dependent receptor [unclassified Sphingobacterium]